MKLSFLKIHKSITSFPELELPDFVVLTGVNGAGKSHLLEAIENGSMRIDDIEVNNQTRPIRRFDWSNLIPQDTGAFAPYQITQEISGLWNEINQYVKESRTHISQNLQYFNRVDLDKLKPRELIGLTAEELTKTGSSVEQASQIIQAIRDTISNVNQNVTNRFIQNDRVNRQRLIDLFQSNTDIPLVAFDEDYFYEHFPRSWQSVDIFQQSLARIFVDYQRNWLTNRLKRVANLEGETVSFLTEEKFLNKYGEPPWEFVNSILETANLDFRINRPPQYEDRPYEPILTDRVRNSQVRFNDLSSGERILMSFALCLYYADDKNKLIVDNPKILLFDEIDAPLHPSMTQSLLRTIQDVLINRRNIKVILTTHSPSTVALAPEQSIYAMYKTEQRRMQKVTKDKALSILTTGVPTLSIDYENRRQVFVESRYDVQFYEKLHEKLKDYLTPEISLNFIASGGGNGTCDQVKDVVNQLKKGGNRTVYGIIDWDLKNCGNGRVKVLGKEKRYSIENYILDPVLIAAFLVREKLIERIEVGLSERETYVDFGTFDDTRLQQIADFIVEKVKPKIQSEVQDDCLLCQYLSRKTIKLPKWFLRIQGHKLEEILKDLFPKLKKFKQEPELKLEIISKVIDDFPSLIPYDILSLLKEVQDVK